MVGSVGRSKLVEARKEVALGKPLIMDWVIIECVREGKGGSERYYIKLRERWTIRGGRCQVNRLTSLGLSIFSTYVIILGSLLSHS